MFALTLAGFALVRRPCHGVGESEVLLTGEEKPVNIFWAEVAKVLKTRNRISCQKKWEYLQVWIPRCDIDTDAYIGWCCHFFLVFDHDLVIVR